MGNAQELAWLVKLPGLKFDLITLAAIERIHFKPEAERQTDMQLRPKHVAL
jgi:hypothetical protein